MFLMVSGLFIGCAVVWVLVSFRERVKNLMKHAKFTFYWFIELRKAENSSSLVI